jgi:hypothetical protein
MSPNGDREHHRPLRLPGPPIPIKVHRRRRSRSDQFYAAWDKFTQRKSKGQKDAVPSLDVGVEGGPGHVVTENLEGVESRLVEFFCYAFFYRNWL